MIRHLDHLVLPTASLAAARARFGALGFTLAADGVHPFGTVNACVYFADGTFLEPLAVGDVKAVEAAAGNVFVSHDAQYRKRQGEDGFSALVIASDDAGADDSHFRDAGISCGPVLDFGRDFVAADGAKARMDFRLAFARTFPDALLFACERINAPKTDRSALTRHANGASRIVRIGMIAPDVAAAAGFFAAALAETPGFSGDAARIGLENAVLDIANGAGPARFASVRFAVASLPALAALLARNGVEFQTSGGVIAAGPAPGQGAIFEFEEAS